MKLGLNDLVDFAQTNFGQDAPPPDGRWGAPPSWIPLDAVDPLQSDADREREPNDPEVQILDPEDSIGVDDDTPDDAPESAPLEIDRYGTDALAYYLPFHFY